MIGHNRFNVNNAVFDFEFRDTVYHAICGCKIRDLFFLKFPLLCLNTININGEKNGDILSRGYLGQPQSITQSEIDFFNGISFVIEAGKLNKILSKNVWRILTSPASGVDEFMINTISTLSKSRQVGLIKLLGAKIELEGAFKKFDNLSCAKKTQILFDFLNYSKCTIQGEEFYSGKLLVSELKKDEQFQKMLNKSLLNDVGFSFSQF